MLNVDRPQNPFIHTNETDWKGSKTTPEGSHALTHEVRDENSYTLSPSSDESQPLQLDTDRRSLRKEVALRGPSSRSSSQSLVASISSNAARKAAPPIPNKPAVLRDRQYSQESGNNEHGNHASSRPLSGGQTVFNDGAMTDFPPPPQRNNYQETSRQHATDSGGPPLPPRSSGAIVSAPKGLMDDDNEGASEIPSLQPMRRQE